MPWQGFYIPTELPVWIVFCHFGFSSTKEASTCQCSSNPCSFLSLLAMPEMVPKMHVKTWHGSRGHTAWSQCAQDNSHILEERQAQRIRTVRCTQHEVSDWLGRCELILACAYLLSQTPSEHCKPYARRIFCVWSALF